MTSAHRNYPVSVFLTFLLHLIPSNMTFWLLACLLGLESMDQSYIGVNHIYRLAPSASIVTTTFPPHVPAYVESPTLCPWSSTLHYVHISSQYPYFISFVKSPSVRWRHTTFSVFSPTWLWLICYSSSQCSATHILLDDCQPVNIKLFQNGISAHRSLTTTH